MNIYTSYFLYLLVLFLGSLLSKLAYETKKKKFIFFIIILLSFFAGLRGKTVGLDTKQYLHIFNLAVNNDPTLSWYGMEKTFTSICAVILKIYNNPNFIFFILSLITNSLILLRMWDFCEIGNYSWMFLSYYVMFYGQTMNISRQFCAVAIIFFGTRYLFKQDYFKYLFFVVIACLFHKSAIIGLTLYLFDIRKWKKLEKKNKIFILLGVMIITVYGGKIVVNLKEYLRYFEFSNIKLGLMLPLKILFWILMGYRLQNTVLRCKLDENVKYEYYEEIIKTKYIYLTGLLVSLLGYFFSYMERIALPFYIFEIVFNGIITKMRTDKKTVKVILFVMYVYFFIMDMFGNGQGIFPYYFFWQ